MHSKTETYQGILPIEQLCGFSRNIYLRLQIVLEIKDGGFHACRSHFRKHICGLCGKKPLPVGNNNREPSSDGNDRRMVIIGRSRGKGSQWGATGRDGANCDSPEKTLPGNLGNLMYDDNEVGDVAFYDDCGVCLSLSFEK